LLGEYNTRFVLYRIVLAKQSTKIVLYSPNNVQISYYTRLTRYKSTIRDLYFAWRVQYEICTLLDENNKGNNKITELRTILQRESVQISYCTRLTMYKYRIVLAKQSTNIVFYSPNKVQISYRTRQTMYKYRIVLAKQSTKIVLRDLYLVRRE
jgi:hypothetical protein